MSVEESLVLEKEIQKVTFTQYMTFWFSYIQSDCLGYHFKLLAWSFNQLWHIGK